MFYYRLYKSPPLNYILNQVNLVHTITYYFFKRRFNIILPSTTRSIKLCLPPGFRTKLLKHLLSLIWALRALSIYYPSLNRSNYMAKIKTYETYQYTIFSILLLLFLSCDYALSQNTSEHAVPHTNIRTTSMWTDSTLTNGRYEV
jgi:hypothetical protein